MAVCLEITKVFGACVFSPGTEDFTCTITGTFANHPPFTVISQTLSQPTCVAQIVSGAGTASARVTFTISGTVDVTVMNAKPATATCTIPVTFTGTAILPATAANTFVQCQVQTFELISVTTEVVPLDSGSALVVHAIVATCAKIKTVATMDYLFPEEPALCPAPTPCAATTCDP